MITSVSNKQVKNLIQLNKKSKERKNQDVFVVEGTKMFTELPKDRLVQVYVSESFFNKKENKKLIQNIKYEILDDRVFEAAADTKTPQGILCVVKQFHYSIEDILKIKNPNLLILEDLQDPGNLGTIMRTGEGAGISGIIMSKNTVDLYNPKTIRSTMGSIYRVPFVYVEDLKETIRAVKEAGITIYAAHLRGENYYDEFDYTKATAFMIGNEGNGLSEEIANSADNYLKIPMEGKVESLNAAVASSILMYESYRQRRKLSF